MTRLKNAVTAFVIMYGLIILLTTAWGGFKDSYDIQEENTVGGENIFQKLSGLDMIAGINDLSMGIQEISKLKVTDILGGIALIASGSLQLIGGVVTFPIDLFGIVSGFYGNILPPIVSKIVGFLVVIGVGFIILSAKLGYEL